MPFNVTQQYDRAILDFGNVTNTGAVTNDVSEEVIIIEWDAVVIQNPLTDDTEDYWVSAGAEYNTETEIWVGQASFNLLTTLPVSMQLHWCHNDHTHTHPLTQSMVNILGPCYELSRICLPFIAVK